MSGYLDGVPNVNHIELLLKQYTELFNQETNFNISNDISMLTSRREDNEPTRSTCFGHVFNHSISGAGFKTAIYAGFTLYNFVMIGVSCCRLNGNDLKHYSWKFLKTAGAIVICPLVHLYLAVRALFGFIFHPEIHLKKPEDSTAKPVDSTVKKDVVVPVQIDSTQFEADYDSNQRFCNARDHYEYNNEVDYKATPPKPIKLTFKVNIKGVDYPEEVYELPVFYDRSQTEKFLIHVANKIGRKAESLKITLLEDLQESIRSPNTAPKVTKTSVIISLKDIVTSAE